MPYTLRPLTLGELLDRTFQLYGRNFVLFLGISAIPNIVMLLLELTLNFNPRSNFNGIAILSPLVVGLASIFIRSVVTAATTFAVSDVYLNLPTTIMACFARVTRKLLRVAYVSFVYGLAVGIGLVLLIVPGIYWAGRYAIAVPTVVLEDLKGGQALERSGSLTKGFVGRLIVIYVVTVAVSDTIVFGASAGIAALAQIGPHHVGILTVGALQQIMATLVAILLGPVLAIALTLAYYDLRVRKEAFDIDHMMSLLGEPKPLPTPSPAS